METHPTIWLVDNDSDDLHLQKIVIHTFLPKSTITSLADGDEVIPTLQITHQQPNLILLDLHTHRQSGFETLKELRAIPTFKKLPIIMLSNSSDQRDRERAIQLGANQFISKPHTFSGYLQIALKLINEIQL